MARPLNPTGHTLSTHRSHRPRPRLHWVWSRTRVVPNPPHRLVDQRRQHQHRPPLSPVFPTPPPHPPRQRPNHHHRHRIRATTPTKNPKTTLTSNQTSSMRCAPRLEDERGRGDHRTVETTPTPPPNAAGATTHPTPEHSETHQPTPPTHHPNRMGATRHPTPLPSRTRTSTHPTPQQSPPEGQPSVVATREVTSLHLDHGSRAARKKERKCSR